jgi:hypothetical protein
MSLARLFWSLVFTKPLKCAVPLKVFTSIMEYLLSIISQRALHAHGSRAVIDLFARALMMTVASATAGDKTCRHSSEPHGNLDGPHFDFHDLCSWIDGRLIVAPWNAGITQGATQI